MNLGNPGLVTLWHAHIGRRLSLRKKIEWAANELRPYIEPGSDLPRDWYELVHDAARRAALELSGRNYRRIMVKLGQPIGGRRRHWPRDAVEEFAQGMKWAEKLIAIADHLKAGRQGYSRGQIIAHVLWKFDRVAEDEDLFRAVQKIVYRCREDAKDVEVRAADVELVRLALRMTAAKAIAVARRDFYKARADGLAC